MPDHDLWLRKVLSHLSGSLRPGGRRVSVGRRQKRFRRLRAETLESRTLLATVTVNTASDVLDGVTSSMASLLASPGPDGVISLREAITAANNTANGGGPDQIHFAIPGPGPYVIQPASALPTLTGAAVIDGSTQPGYSDAPLIELDGVNAGSANGLYITSGGSTVRGLAIGRFSGYGIRLRTGGGNVIAGSFIGTDSTGTAVRANADGVYVDSSPNNVIGGLTPAERNVISGNGDDGITISGTASTGNLVVGNFLGTDRSGMLDLGNGGDGILIRLGAAGNTIGGVAAGAANVISGNGNVGVALYSAGTWNNAVQGNLIGTTAAGSSALANADDGVHIDEGASNNTIGGTDVAARNVISGNGADGIELRAAATTGNTVLGNYIGTDPSGAGALANGSDGIEIEGAAGNTIGGSAAGAGNLISGNASDGIEMFGTTAVGNQFLGNRIGTDAAGTARLPNGNNGLWIGSGATNNVIGGTAAGAGNVISGNASDGIELSGTGTAGNEVLGNLIGVGADGIAMLGNQIRGIYLGAGVANTVVGRAQAGAANVIAHNGAEGILLAADAGSGNAIRGNSIFFNTELGIDLSGSATVSKGVTPNDAGDADAGANGLQNFPVLTLATTDGTSVQVGGTLHSNANANFTIDFYRNTPPLGINDGETWIGSTQVITDAAGDGSFHVTLAASVPAGCVLTATATGAGGSTSEFSLGRQIGNLDGTPLVSIRDAGVIEGDSGTRNAVFTVELSQACAGAVTVDYSTASGSALADSDFAPRSGQLVFLGGETAHTISVPVYGEAEDESLERFFVNLTAATPATIWDGQAIGWITDNDQTSNRVPYGAAAQDTSEFMLGTVFVTVVLLESDGRIDPDLERFSPSQNAAMQTKIQEGLQWWEDLLALQGTVHTLDYLIDFTYAEHPIRTPYEPLSRSSADQGLWITSFLQTVGADTAASHHTDLDAYNHLRRLEAGTNWAFTLFITNGWNDADGRYPDDANAWAYAGGPYTVIQQHRSKVTVAHEIGHIFYNLDEYPDGRSYYDRRGYYNTQNLNAYEDHPDLSQRVPSLMAETADVAFANYTSSPTSLEMIGWRDSDGDGLFDVLDVPLTLTGAGTYDAAARTYRFQGYSAVQTLPNQNSSGLGNEITINRVSRAQYRIDDGAWNDVAVYQQYQASLDLTIPVQPNRKLEIRTIDDASGVTSPVFLADTAPGTLIVTEFVPTSSGFVAKFGRDIEPSVLNLYDSASQTLGAADVTVVGATHGAVRGSLVVSADQRQVTFVQTGGLLEPDTYTVTLFSGATRFREPTGGTLDGNADGTTGDNYQTTFTVNARLAGTVTIGLPDMARGAGQPVNIPTAAAGLPIRLSDAAGVTSLAVDLAYGQDLLAITAAALAAGLPGDWSVALDTSTPGVAKITASGSTALSGTNVDIVRLTAAVPSNAPYGAVQAIRLQNVSLNGGAIAAVGDVAVHKAAYLGDADGSGIHSSADAFLTVQAALGLASGFAAHAWTDPRIMGDADGSGVLSAADAFLIVQEGLGLSEPFVPDNPHIGITPVGGGVDPQFQIDVNLPASAGGVVTVPVKLAIEPAATNVGAIDFDLFFDPAQLTIQLPEGVSAGADTGGWAVSAILVAPGQLRVGMVSSTGQPLTPGLREIARLQFRVAASLRDADSLTERAAYGDATPVSERPGYVVALAIEPVDPHAGGYTWTAVDGSVLLPMAVERRSVGGQSHHVGRNVGETIEHEAGCRIGFR